MPSPMEEFQAWLTNKLLTLNSDDSFITDYINGILTGDESQTEKEEALQGILCGIMVSAFQLLWIYRFNRGTLVQQLWI